MQVGSVSDLCNITRADNPTLVSAGYHKTQKQGNISRSCSFQFQFCRYAPGQSLEF